MEIPTTVYSLFILIALYISIALLLRSLFFIIQSRYSNGWWNIILWFISIVGGIIHLLNVSDKIIHHSTSIFLILFLIGSSFAIYAVAKSKGLYSYLISQQTKEIINNLAIKFSPKSGKQQFIDYEILESFEIGVAQWIDGLAIVRYATAYDGLFFQTVFPPSYSMIHHRHDDCEELCYIVEGEMIDLVDGKIYKAGELVKYNAKELHQPMNNKKNSKLVVHVYFKKVNNES